MKKPFHAKGDKAIKVSAETVFTTVKAIIDAGKEKEFLAVCAKSKASVSVAPKFVNLAKDYLFDNQMHAASVAVADVVRSARCPTDP